MNGTVSYALSKQMVASVTAGIDHWEVDDTEKTLTVYTLDGTELTLHFEQPSGIQSIDVDANNHLVVTYTDGRVETTENVVPTVEGYSPTITVYRNADDQYVLDIHTKDSHYLTPNLKGADGADGKSFTIKAQYPTYAALIAAHPTGEPGDAYFVGEDTAPDLYVWLEDDQEWYNAGQISGIKGDPGRGILSFEVGTNDHLLVNMDDGTVEDTGFVPVVHYEIVDELPTGEDISLMTIYLLPIEGVESGYNQYEEYIYVYNEDTSAYQWEKFGERTVEADAKLKNAMTATKAVGGVSVGKTWAQGTDLETVLRDVLSPVLTPVIVAPSSSLGKNPSATLLEVGATLAVTFTVSLNRGSITPAYAGGPSQRSGSANGYSLNGGTKQSGNTFSETVSESNKSFYGTAYYDAGEQPKASDGSDFDHPLPAGSCNTSVLNYEFVDALYSNAANITVVAKESLISKSTKQKEWMFPAQTVANPEEFHVPASWNVSAIEVLNDLSGKYEDASAEFDVGTTTHNNAAGIAVNYKTYRDNRGYNAAARTIRIKWS